MITFDRLRTLPRMQVEALEEAHTLALRIVTDALDRLTDGRERRDALDRKRFLGNDLITIRAYLETHRGWVPAANFRAL